MAGISPVPAHVWGWGLETEVREIPVGSETAGISPVPPTPGVSASLWAFSEAWPSCPTVVLLLLPGTHHLWDGFHAGAGTLISFCSSTGFLQLCQLQRFPSPVSGTESLCLFAHIVGNAKGCVLAENLECGKARVSLCSCCKEFISMKCLSCC